MSVLTCGYTLTCDDETTIGGVRRLFLINRTSLDKEDAFMPDPDPDNYCYNSYTIVGTTASLENRWHEFEFLEYTLNATFENSLEANGTNFVSYNVSGFIPRQEKFKAKKLQDAIKSCKLVAIVQNNKGEAFLYGYDETMKLDAALRAAANGETGADLADRSGYEFRLEGRGSDIPRQFIGTIVTTDGTSVTFS